MRLRLGARVFAGWLTLIPASQAQDDPAAAQSGEELAKKLQNPVASLISVPFQSNFEFDGGPDDEGFRYLLNVQPVIPISISEDWNLISRTILPIIHQDDMIGSDTQGGLGDITQSAFFSPKAPGFGGLIWGAGPVFLLPTATDDLLGAEQFGIGPTAVVLKQESGWTYGMLANHIWSVAGEDDRDDVSSSFLPLCLLHNQKADHLRNQHGVHLRLGERAVDGACERDGEPASKGRQTTLPASARRQILRGCAEWRPRLGDPLHHDLAVSEVSGD